MARSIRLKNNDYWCMDYACLFTRGMNLSNLTPWTLFTVPFSNDPNSEFITNTSNFERNGNYIKCKFKGKVLVYRQISHNIRYELDIADEFGGIVDVIGGKNQSLVILNVNYNDDINFMLNTGFDNFTIYNARLIVVRIA